MLPNTFDPSISKRSRKRIKFSCFDISYLVVSCSYLQVILDGRLESVRLSSIWERFGIVLCRNGTRRGCCVSPPFSTCHYHRRVFQRGGNSGQAWCHVRRQMARSWADTGRRRKECIGGHLGSISNGPFE